MTYPHCSEHHHPHGFVYGELDGNPSIWSFYPKRSGKLSPEIHLTKLKIFLVHFSRGLGSALSTSGSRIPPRPSSRSGLGVLCPAHDFEMVHCTTSSARLRKGRAEGDLSPMPSLTLLLSFLDLPWLLSEAQGLGLGLRGSPNPFMSLVAASDCSLAMMASKFG
ncbi:MAG: hypothetical protein GY696_13380 [Gammaproteobacteria bacterium]|nr:hypothetical protein [Gammaproteobacteria bacterium]